MNKNLIVGMIVFVMCLVATVFAATTQTGNDIRTDGFLHVGGTIEGASESGDGFFSGNVVFNRSIFSRAILYGASILGVNSGTNINFTSSGGTGKLNATTAIFCDSTNPFVAGNKGMFLTIIESTPDYDGATGEINSYINSTCVELSLAAAGLRSVSDVTNASYYVYNHPNFAVLDRGDVHVHVGKNQDAKFSIHVDDGRGFYGVHLEDTAGVDQHQSLTIDTDTKAYDGVVGLNMIMSSSNYTDGVDSRMIVLEADGSNYNNSDGTFITMSMIGLPENSVSDAFSIDARVDRIIKMGSTDPVSSAYYNDVNVTANFTGVGNDATVFINDDDFIYVGNTLNFTIVSFALSTLSSGNLGFAYYYCNSTGGWEVLSVIDTTAGFTKTGSVTFINPSDRGVCNKEYDGTPFSDTNSYTYIAIQRTKNNVVVKPVVDVVGISGGTTYFVLQEDMMKVNPVDVAPETCDASYLGSLYFDISEDQFCQCTSGGWKEMDDASEACT